MESDILEITIYSWAKSNSNVWNFPLYCGIKGGRFSQLLAIYLSCQDLRGKKRLEKRARLPASCVTISQLLVKVRKWKKKLGQIPVIRILCSFWHNFYLRTVSAFYHYKPANFRKDNDDQQSLRSKESPMLWALC